VTDPADRTSAVRPPAIDVAAAILAFGGLFGFGQLFGGEFAITGVLPAADPILGVAFILYAASVVLGVLIRVGRGWLAAVSLAALFALLYLVAMARPVNALLGVAHVVAVAILVIHRRWFTGPRSAP
jgi:hypothetical protein